MSTLTTEQFERQLDGQTERILGSVKRGFDELSGTIQEQRRDIAGVKGSVATLSHDLQTVKDNLSTLTTSVDRFAKIYTGLNQEFVVMRRQLRDVEVRVEKLELHLRAT